MHAEQNAIALAARQGTATEDSLLYVTLRPCFGCLKEAIQAGVREIVFDQPFDYQPDLEEAYQELLSQSSIAMRQHPYSATHPVAPVATPMTQGHGEEMPTEQEM